MLNIFNTQGERDKQREGERETDRVIRVFSIDPMLLGYLLEIKKKNQYSCRNARRYK